MTVHHPSIIAIADSGDVGDTGRAAAAAWAFLGQSNPTVSSTPNDAEKALCCPTLHFRYCKCALELEDAYLKDFRGLEKKKKKHGIDPSLPTNRQ